MSKIFFTSDLHIGHKKIVEYTKRGKDTTQEDHDKWLTDLWNSQVSRHDIVYQLGDFVFNCRDLEVWQSVVSKLNGRIIHIKGNHDSSDVLKKSGHEWYDLKRVKIGKQHIVMCHFALRVWDMYHHGAWQIYGHCVDDSTEILTADGWKSRNNISVGEAVVSYNIEKKEMEYDTIKEVHDVNYSGDVYSAEGKSFSYRVTSNHNMVVKSRGDGTVYKMIAEDFSHRGRTLIGLSEFNTSLMGCGLSESMLKLYIFLAADGSIKRETSLARIVVHKQRKVDYVEGLLHSLGIDSNYYVRSNGTKSLNFRLPTEIESLNIKGLDKLLLKCNRYDCEHIFDAYANSDGSMVGDTLVICSAKECEVDLLQAMFVQNGYMCTKSSRIHGFSKNVQYSLSVTDKTWSTTDVSKTVKKEEVSNEHFWCVTTGNGTWVQRRNGKCMITGNSHGSLDGIGKQVDVGLDSAYNILGEHRFFTMDDLRQIMSEREVVFHDHHTERTNQ